MIVDAHVHLGIDRVFDEVRTEEEILESMEKNGVDVSVVQTMAGTIDIEDIRRDHDRIYSFSKNGDKKIFGMASHNPHIRKEYYVNELKRCIEELGFVGVKLHAFAHACNPLSKDGGMIWETAGKLDIPVMVHTGPGIPFSLPAMVIPRAKEFPEITVILAHSGLVTTAGEAMIAASESKNVILETSWTAAHHIEHFVKKFGSSRVMFASDEITNLPVEIAKYDSLPLSKDDKQQCMSETAKDVFKLIL
jgi:uncharacterized protein